MHRLTAPTNPNTAPTKTGEVQSQLYLMNDPDKIDERKQQPIQAAVRGIGLEPRKTYDLKTAKRSPPHLGPLGRRAIARTIHVG